MVLLVALAIVQAVLLVLQGFHVINWPWYFLLAPIEIALVSLLGFCGYLMTTKTNPFQ
jgi:hypothetical protein